MTAISIVLAIVVILLRRIAEKAPTSTSSAILHIFWDWLIEYGRTFLGEYTEDAMPFLATVFIFILTSNWTGDLFASVFESLGIPFRTPTANISVTAGLAIGMLLWIHGWFIRHFGMKKYLSIYFAPMWWMFPLNILEHLTRVVSLSLRLYGNVSGEHLVVAILAILAPFFLPLPMIALSLFTGFIQAYIFFTLGLVYLGAMIEEGGAHHE